MIYLQSILESRNTALRRTTRAFQVAVFTLLTVVACDFLVTDGTPSTPSDPPPPPGSDPNPDPGPASLLLTRAPYLQALSRTSVVLAFRTEGAVEVAVDYGTSLGYGGSATGPASMIHAVRLEGLAPGQRYYYRVRSGNEILAAGASYFFDTDAGSADNEFSFFVTGDIGDSGGEQELTAQRILQTAPRAEMGLLSGDIVYPDGAASDYDAKLMQPWAPLMRSVAIWPALGNHDWHVDPEPNFCAQWVLPNNEHYYSFDRGNAHFIALDTQDGQVYDRDNQVDWLRADLAAHRSADWTFVFYHHPGYTCTYKGDDQDVIESFHPLFDEFGVDVVFMGHAHTYERLYPMRGATPMNQEQEPNYTNPSGTIYIVSGAGSKTNSAATVDCAINAVAVDDTVLFTHVTVRGNMVRIRAIVSESGAVRDEVTITKTGI